MEDFLLIPGFSCFLFVFGHHVCISFVSTMYNRLRQNFNNYFIHNRQVIYYINICKWGEGKERTGVQIQSSKYQIYYSH